MSTLTWIPKRIGRRYCSTACGGGCTRTAFQQATKDAKKLAARLNRSVPSGKWTTRVWENLGWHYSVTSKALCMDVHNHGYFYAYLQVGGPWGGNLVVSGSTPEIAVDGAFQTAKTQLKPIIELYAALVGGKFEVK